MWIKFYLVNKNICVAKVFQHLIESVINYVLFASVVAPLRFWLYGIRKIDISFLTSARWIGQARASAKPLCHSDREKTRFPYFELYCLQAAIDSFAVLSLSKIYHSRTLKSCWLGCISYTSSLTKYSYKSLKWLLLHVLTKCWDQPHSKGSVLNLWSAWLMLILPKKAVRRFCLTKSWQALCYACWWN